MNPKHISGVLILSAIIITGCVDNLPPEEIQARLVEANTNVKSYTGTFMQDMEITTTVRGEPTTTKSTGNSDVAYDRENKRMKMVSSMNLNKDGADSEIETEWYVVDGYSYTKVGETWTKRVFNVDMWETLFENEDQLKLSVMLIKNGTIEQLPDESFNGKSYYVIEAKPNLEQVLRNALSRAGRNPDGNGDDVKTYTMKVWIDKDSFVMEKMITRLHIDIPSSTSEEGRIRHGMEMISNIELQFFNINEEVIIELPDEALNAPDIPLSDGSGTAAPKVRDPSPSRGGGTAADSINVSSLKQKIQGLK